MRKRLYILLAVLFIVLAAVVVIFAFQKEEKMPTIDKQTLYNVRDINQMAFGFFDAVRSSAKSDENIIISPLSVAEVLAILSNGANGQTRDEILKVLNIKANDIDSINATFLSLNEFLPHLKKGSVLKLANSVWIDKKYDVNSDFKDLAKKYYFASTFSRDLPTDETRKAYNSWCKDKTDGFMKEPQKENFDPTTALVLANTLYFNGSWAIPFDEEMTGDSLFYASDNTQNTVKMMYMEDDLRCCFGKKFDVAILDYAKSEVQMEILLPHKGVSLEQCLKGMTAATWWSFRQNSFVKNIDLYMPRMEFDFTASLNEALEALGMKKAFSQSADFSGISNQNVHLSEVRQTGKISVNEKGTKVAAATDTWTEIGMYMPLEFNMNRPFAFVIRHHATGAILFMGCVNKL